ncbi:MAG: hypothetical protein ACM3JG_18160 [Thiohalocapsa sp.]
MAKAQTQLRAEESSPPELRGEFETFVEDHRAACHEAGIRPVFNYTTFAYMIRRMEKGRGLKARFCEQGNAAEIDPPGAEPGAQPGSH